MIKTRPFLKWAGSKFNCINQIVSELPPGCRLIEPFTGSGAVFINTHYSSYLLAENNGDLVNIYSILQKEGQAFIDLCRPYFQPEFNIKEKYLELRSTFNSISDIYQKSALFLYLNRHGYNGLCRYNSSGIFNVPFGLYKTPYFPLNELIGFHKKSQNAQFIHSDFRKIFELAEKGDVIYCDPPYVPISKKTKPLAYTQQKFEEKDQIELAELAKESASKGIPVIISNHDTEFTRQLYKEARVKSFKVSRYINCQADMRRPVMELVAVFKK